MQRLALAALIATALTASASAANDSADSYSLTLQQRRPRFDQPRGLARRAARQSPATAWYATSARLPLDKGRNPVRFVDVAGRIDPTKVTFESLTDPADTIVLEQNFQFDLISQD